MSPSTWSVVSNTNPEDSVSLAQPLAAGSRSLSHAFYFSRPFNPCNDISGFETSFSSSYSLHLTAFSEESPAGVCILTVMNVVARLSKGYSTRKTTCNQQSRTYANIMQRHTNKRKTQKIWRIEEVTGLRGTYMRKPVMA